MAKNPNSRPQGLDSSDDERLGHSDDAASSRGDPRVDPFLNDRTERPGDPDRQSRTVENRALSENRVMTDDERADAFRLGMYQEILPLLPPIPGYQSMWHTTTNPRDSVQRRLMLGYEFITPEECGGLNLSQLKSAEYPGAICMREMIALKLPNRLYLRYMSIAHHEGPNKLAEAIVAAVDQRADELKEVGSKLMEGSGMKGIREEMRRRPQFDLE